MRVAYIIRQSKNMPISGTILLEKTIEIACGLGNAIFKASNGWLESFKKRHQVMCMTVSGTAAK